MWARRQCLPPTAALENSAEKHLVPRQPAQAAQETPGEKEGAASGDENPWSVDCACRLSPSHRFPLEKEHDDWSGPGSGPWTGPWAGDGTACHGECSPGPRGGGCVSLGPELRWDWLLQPVRRADCVARRASLPGMPRHDLNSPWQRVSWWAADGREEHRDQPPRRKVKGASGLQARGAWPRSEWSLLGPAAGSPSLSLSLGSLGARPGLCSLSGAQQVVLPAA